jgi:aminoglycoside phosphotransferase (APT) family kinase protein
MKDQFAALGDVLKMMRRDTASTISPEMQSPFGKYTSMTMILMLDQMALWLAQDGNRELHAARARMIERLGGDDSVSVDGLHRDFEDHSGNGLVLSRLIENRLAKAPCDELTPLVSAIAHDELAWLNAERSAVAKQTERDSSLISQVEFPINCQTLDCYFEQSEVFKGYRARSVWQIPGGYSKDTYMIGVVDRHGDARDIVLRRDFPAGPTETSAADEFGILSKLSNLGLPVARPLEAVHDRAVLGQPFLVVERVPGENAADHFDQDPQLARSVCYQLADTLGRLHALDPVELGLTTGDVGGPADQIRTNLEQWKSFWKRNRRTGSPMVEAAFVWLEANIPADVARLVAVHGDARQHNVMIENGRLTALLDWEFIHAGDPAEDLEYTKIYTAPYVEWTDFMNVYLSAGGVRASDSGSRFYEVFRAVRNFICCDVAWSGFATGTYPVNKLAVQGLVYRRDFLRWIGEALVRVTSSCN